MKKIFGIFCVFGFMMANGAQFFSRYQKSRTQSTSERSSQSITYDIGLGLQHYKYEEPGVMSIRGPMVIFDGKIGILKGLFKYQIDGYYSSHIGFNVYNGGLIDIQTKVQKPYSTKATDFYLGLNAKAGLSVVKDIKQSIFLYVGLGYWILDNFNIDPPHITASYERIQGYLYAPIGIDLEIPTSATYSMLAEFEFRTLLFGHNSSLTKRLHFDSNLHFTQGFGQGFGLNIKAGMKFYVQDYAFKVIAFYNYWDIADSTTQVAYKKGVAQGVFVEPNNNTNNMGLMIGFSF